MRTASASFRPVAVSALAITDTMIGQAAIGRNPLRVAARGRNTALPESNRLLQLQSDPVVHRVPEALLAAQVSFSCLHGDVPKQKLDLLKLTARGVAQPGARAAIMPHAALAS